MNYLKAKEEFKELLASQKYKESLNLLKEMHKLIDKETHFKEFISLFLNKSLVYSKLDDWVSVVNESLKGLLEIKQLKNNFIKYSKFSKEEKENIKNLEKKYF